MKIFLIKTNENLKILLQLKISFIQQGENIVEKTIEEEENKTPIIKKK